MKAGEMTIEEAIRHAEEVAQRKCDECGNQHRQLANWLKELVVLRFKLKVAGDALEKIITGCFSHKDGDKPIAQAIIDIAGSSLAAIREEGGAE